MSVKTMVLEEGARGPVTMEVDISFCVSCALSPLCDLYRYRCGHEWVRFQYSG